jgi:hypothetical protein
MEPEVSRMSRIDAATSRYQNEMTAATERAEATARNVRARCAELVAAAEKAIEIARTEADGREASAVDLAEKAIADATRRLDRELSTALGAPPNATVKDSGAAMDLYLGDQLVGSAGPASGSYIVSVGTTPSVCVGTWIAARTQLWREARTVADRPTLAGVRA